jgi:hypothetical protein
MEFQNGFKEKNLRLGILGMSPGNGHPYSWSAIFNGYNDHYMKDCPFPVIPQYLSNQVFPRDAIKGAKVTHIWTQNEEISRHIALASNIDNVVKDPVDMIGSVDGILLARDDYETHYEMSKPFIEAGLHIFIDKPLAVTVSKAEEIFALEQFTGQIFTCSAFRFAKEFRLTEEELFALGDIRHINAWIMKDWEKYAIHVIEPSLNFLPKGFAVESSNTSCVGETTIVSISFDCGATASFSTLGSTVAAPTINLFGSTGYKSLVFSDTFHAFKRSLEAFIGTMRGALQAPSPSAALNIVRVIEAGLIRS